MDNPLYKYVYLKEYCSKLTVYVNVTAVYRYDSEKNLYQLTKRTCEVREGLSSYKKCSGLNRYNEPCFIVNPPLIELPPDSPKFDSPNRLLN